MLHRDASLKLGHLAVEFTLSRGSSTEKAATSKGVVVKVVVALVASSAAVIAVTATCDSKTVRVSKRVSKRVKETN